ncbi:MAG: 5-(carboxyamino)imidazole ribonucleotide mutase [Chloroflexi bacterium]|nr:5-(carboxyamino)imidazole ribonucleotide mutase [Chloroflexota bacterium]MCY3697914.1 5-(carboxyamino)imidazole ribonucleotide mutase [Chloroflexota bacterium]MXX80992.1 5-(carboxyamino)imidazole ribonucleotide mutase [Chloroflexota bacterium]MYB22170.1 5-(carboxyamino)imidazole ribonucleotide mutase [Chloroflexota bacterium]MYF21675.1 5-(carboxyamino)imidazole ribonucleotide mutase [Chloroflexota bacterium]
MTDGPLVGVMMGSHSDWETIKNTASTLESLGISWEARVLSAHRTPDETAEYAAEAQGRGIKVIIAAAGGAAALPGAVAAKTPIPVIGVPVKGWATDGLDSLLSMAQMPRGVPVATVAIGRTGAVNAALLAGRILALSDPAIADAVARDSAQRAAEQLSQPHPTLD